MAAAETGAGVVVELDDMDEDVLLETPDVPTVPELLALEVLEDEPPLLGPLLGD